MRLLQKSKSVRLCHGELVEPYNEINDIRVPFDKLRVTSRDFCKSLDIYQYFCRTPLKIASLVLFTDTVSYFPWHVLKNRYNFEVLQGRTEPPEHM